jgi:ADP-ribose pyrophosphatase YjhB (NUDIX family)
VRDAARALVLDEKQRVLLLRYDECGGFWTTPGGAREEGEVHATAILRELGEELGINETAIKLGMQLAERSATRLVGGHEVRQVERYFAARLSPGDVRPERATQPDNIREYRWWTREGLRSTAEAVYPQGLADLIAAVVEGCTPQRPIILSG